MRERILGTREKGQSVVEAAIALPILLLLAIGIVELGFALNAYNQTINASREGARFGSMGGSDSAISSIVQGAPAYLLSYSEENADLYVVRAELGGTAPNCSVISDTFSCNLVWDNPLVNTSCVSQTEILDRLGSAGVADCDLEVVGVDLHYRSPSLLGLPLVKQLSEAVLMRSFTVMREEPPRPLSGICNAYPIAVHRSVLAGMKPNNGEVTDDILNGTGDGNFGWLRWPWDTSGGSAERLAEALTRPMTSEFQNCDVENEPDDTHLSVNDWICSNTGVSNDIKVRTALDNLMAKGWIRIVVFDEHTYDQGGANGAYHAEKFAIVKLKDYHLPSSGGEGNRIKIEFVRYDSTGCIE